MNKSIRHMPCKRFSCYSWHTESFLNKRWKHWCNNLTIFKTPIGNQDVVYWQNKPFLFTLLEFQRNNQGQAHIHGFVTKSRLGITPIKLNRVQKELISLISDFFSQLCKMLDRPLKCFENTNQGTLGKGQIPSFHVLPSNQLDLFRNIFDRIKC